MDSPFRSGFACFVGRPNAGKSTLTNALVGSKIAIASSKPQTTRHAVRGIVHRPDAQLVLIDTPGLHKPRTLLGERLNDVVRTTWSEVDVIGVCLPADQRIGPGDGYLVGEIAALPRRPQLVAVATKSDLVTPSRMAEHLTAIAALEAQHGIRWAHIIPVSALLSEGGRPPSDPPRRADDTRARAVLSEGGRPPSDPPRRADDTRARAVLSEGGRPPSDPPRRADDTRARAQPHHQLDVLADLLVSLLPEGPQLYPDGEITDEPTETLVAELIREAALEGVRDELPHSITVAVEEMGLREGRPEHAPLLDIYASMIVERDSQKGIVIGHRGSRLREIGAAARSQIEVLLGTPVYLDLRVKVLKEWQRDPKHLNRLGF